MAKLIDLTGATVHIDNYWERFPYQRTYYLDGYILSGSDRIPFTKVSFNCTLTTDLTETLINVYYDYTLLATLYPYQRADLVIIGGLAVESRDIIEWVLENGSVEGGVWEEDDIPRIIYNNEVIAELGDGEVTILCAGKKMLSDIVIVNPVVNNAEEEGLYFYIDGTKFVLPEEGITFRTLLKNYGTVNGSNKMYYGEGSTGIWSKCIYSDPNLTDTSIKSVFYSESGGGVEFGLKVSSIANLNSTIVTGGEYIVISGGGVN